jgi:hypothetical protein
MLIMAMAPAMLGAATTARLPRQHIEPMVKVIPRVFAGVTPFDNNRPANQPPPMLPTSPKKYGS